MEDNIKPEFAHYTLSELHKKIGKRRGFFSFFGTIKELKKKLKI